jgi:hypothetical protein
MIRALSSCLLVLFAAAVVQAQDTTKPGGTKEMTISGCLGGGPKTFVLTNVIASGDKKGDRGTSGSAGLASAYTLVPREGLALEPHVGRRVELTGTVVSPGTKGEDEAKADARTRARGPEAQFAVTSVRVISPICIQ